MEEIKFDELIKNIQEETKNKLPKYDLKAIPKKSGGIRLISIPDDFTLKVQKEILSALNLLNLEISDAAKAFKEGTSILDNAKAHVGNKYVIRYDMRDFFDTVFVGRVKAELEKRNVPPQFIKIISKWCIHRGHIPQGAPTSPLLSNLVCANLDKRFINLAEKIGAAYTRYADDIIISGDKNVLINQSVFKRIIRTEHFFINYQKIWISVIDAAETWTDNPDAKFFFQYHIITGIGVDDERVFIRPYYVNKLWNEIKSDEFAKNLKFKCHVLGKILFVYFVEPKAGIQFYKYMIKKDIALDEYQMQFVPKIFRQHLTLIKTSMSLVREELMSQIYSSTEDLLKFIDDI